MQFDARKVVITGASPDFGRTLAIQFARLGAELFLTARTLVKAQATEHAVRQIVPAARIECFAVDLSDPAAIGKFHSGLERLTDRVDILINNGSHWINGFVADVSDAEIVEAVNSTAVGSILMTKHVLPLLRRSTGADIVFINATPGLQHNRHATANEAFSAAKAAQAAFADRMRFKLKGTGIRVTTIYPPNFNNTSPVEEHEWNRRRDDFKEELLTARNVLDSIFFALSQDRVCSVDEIVLTNNNGRDVGN
jgi:NADP-dependent 3-hydroxy acid dehydrogenase YdfG